MNGTIHKIYMKVKIARLLLFIFLVPLSTCAQVNKQIKNSEVVNWIEDYFLTNGYLFSVKDSSNLDVSENNLKQRYHAFQLESRNFDSVKVFIYQIGVNITSNHDRFLIYKKYKAKKSTFEIIGESLGLENVNSFYKFFNQYNRFSPGTRLVCYEKVIGDKYYLDIVYPKVSDQ